MSAEPYFWLQPLVTGLGALTVLTGAGITVRQRYKADRREQWWLRTQWALDHVVSGEEERLVLGLQVLAQQTEARLTDREDAAFVKRVITPVADDYLRVVDAEPGKEDHEGGRTAEGARDDG